jgi:CRP-like cAMP-binding protein
MRRKRTHGENLQKAVAQLTTEEGNGDFDEHVPMGLSRSQSGTDSNGHPPAVPAFAENNLGFRLDTFLTTISNGQETVCFSKNHLVFKQGEIADAVFYIQEGKVRLTVASNSGKEGGLGILTRGDFCGEGCLGNQRLRMGSAVAMTECAVLRIDKKVMMDALQREHEFSDFFVECLLARNIRYEEDMIDHLFNSSEKRLARILLLLAHGKQDKPETVIPKISDKILAGMVGTTRPRINLFMNRFRKLGLIHYDEHLEVHNSLLCMVLQDSPLMPFPDEM